MTHDDHLPDDLPPKLKRQLHEASSPPLFVPPEVDRAVLDAAAHHLRPLRRQHRVTRFTRRALPWAGAAAAAVIGFGLLLTQWPAPTSPPLARNLEDRVTILDAFALARHLRDGEARSPLDDVNGDGAVDDRDVKALAQRAVKLPGDEG